MKEVFLWFDFCMNSVRTLSRGHARIPNTHILIIPTYHRRDNNALEPKRTPRRRKAEPLATRPLLLGRLLRRHEVRRPREERQ